MNINIINIRYSIMNCAAWAMIACYMFYLKYIDLYTSYFLVIQEVTYGDTPRSFLGEKIDMLHFFASDIWLFLLGSFVLVAAHFLIKRKILILLQTALTLVVIIVLYANQHSWGTVGQYLNFSSVLVAATFALEAPDTALSYFDADSLRMIGFIILVAIILTIWGRALAHVGILKKIIIPVYVAVVIISVGSLIAGAFSKSENYPVMASFLGSSVVELMPSFSEETKVYIDEGNVAAKINFSGKVRTPEELDALKASLGIKGKEDHDLIIFVLETVPAKFMSLKDNLSDYPALTSLAGHSLIGNSHHTTFPASSEAFTSIIFGQYPPRSYYQTCLLSEKVKKDKMLPGLVANLAAKGYQAGIYMPYKAKSPLDVLLHAKSGFSKIYYANVFDGKDGVHRDEQALKEMLSNIESWTNKDQRYVSFFLPQVGHAPWAERKKTTSVVEYGRALTIMQDKWLAKVIELLKKQGRLEKTTIVITGDHGIRTAEEDEDFIPGKIDAYTYKVPLFIYSAQISGKNYINAPTSHIDIAPTLEALHNLGNSNDNYVGMPLWEAKGAGRDIFFPAGWYFSSDGFLQEGQYYMSYPFLGLTYQNNEMSFSPEHITKNIEVKEMVKTKIQLFYNYQIDRIEKTCDLITR